MASARMGPRIRAVTAMSDATWPVTDHSGCILIQFTAGRWKANGETMKSAPVADARAVGSADGQAVPAAANLRRM
jgi:hypothetical protein